MNECQSCKRVAIETDWEYTDDGDLKCPECSSDDIWVID